MCQNMEEKIRKTEMSMTQTGWECLGLLDFRNEAAPPQWSLLPIYLESIIQTGYIKTAPYDQSLCL